LNCYKALNQAYEVFFYDGLVEVFCWSTSSWLFQASKKCSFTKKLCRM